MTRLLVLKSSASGAASVSNRLVDDLVARLKAERAEIQVTERDLDREPVPHVTQETLAGIGRAAPETPSTVRTRRLADSLIGELKAADMIVIGAPMYNFGIPSTLKSWFDHVLRAGETFRYTEKGPEGLAGGRPVVVIETRGGLYSAGPAASFDSQEPHLRTLLGFMGLDDVRFVRAEKLGMGAPEPEIAAAAAALAEVPLPELARAA